MTFKQSMLWLLVKTYAALIIWLIIGKILFILYHLPNYLALSKADQWGLFWHGARMDAAIAAYIILLPALLFSIGVFFKKNTQNIATIARIYILSICIIITCIYVVDLELYRSWHIRIDNSPIKYLAHPIEMWASAGAAPIALLAVIGFIYMIIVWYFLHKIFSQKHSYSPIYSLLHFGGYLLLLGMLIIPIRGGIQLAPLNQSTVYFSANNFANQAAINPVFNLVHALTKRENGQNPFDYMPNTEAEAIVATLKTQYGKTQKILNTKRPNILLITWESLTAKALNRSLTNNRQVLPHFESLIKEGLYFTNCYASGDRSDKGLIALLSGYPAQPIASIMTVPQKTAKLPSLSAQLKAVGYHTAWYYGGEPEFANIKTYITNGQYDRLVTKEDYPDSLTNTKWGASDANTFTKLLSDLKQQKEPFFINTFTLSSHEPFDVEDHQVIKGNDECSKFLNALHYTDQQLGSFLAAIKKEKWYKNTLIIIVADHGHRLPATPSRYQEHHIPMLWLGGALNAKNTSYGAFCNQTDLAATLLAQLDMEHGQFVWSKNLFIENVNQHAYFAFRNGFGFVDKHNKLLFDNASKQPMHFEGTEKAKTIAKGKAYVQLSYADFLAK
jgi:phosphoglycerol transferase MdoB-like AlkP superfamily enzyme